MHWHWHCILHCHCHWHWGEGSIRSWSRVATFGRRGELPAELGVFFREPLQLRGRILSAFGLRIEYSVFNAIIFIVIVLLAFERRVESRRRRRGDQLIIVFISAAAATPAPILNLLFCRFRACGGRLWRRTIFTLRLQCSVFLSRSVRRRSRSSRCQCFLSKPTRVFGQALRLWHLATGQKAAAHNPAGARTGIRP